jgi:hypothetical protein
MHGDVHQSMGMSRPTIAAVRYLPQAVAAPAVELWRRRIVYRVHAPMGAAAGEDSNSMIADRSDAGLTVVGRLPEGYIILCSQNGDEYSFLVKSLGISVECPHCGATRCGPELAAENYDAEAALTGGDSAFIAPQSSHLPAGEAG